MAGFWSRVRALSTLSIVQVATLAVAVLCPATVLFVVQGVPWVNRAWTAEFAVSTMVFVFFTIHQESSSSFVCLCLLLLQQAAYLSATCFGDRRFLPEHAWLRWGIVALKFAGLLLYASLQVCVRRRWGWHQYRIGISGEHATSNLRKIQHLHAALMFDAVQSALAASGVFLVPALDNGQAIVPLTHRVLVAANCAIAVLLSPFAAMLAHLEDRKGILICCGIYLVGLSVMTFVTAMLAVTASPGYGVGDWSIIQWLTLSELFAALLARLATLWCAVAATKAFEHGLLQRWRDLWDGRRGHQGAPLISEEDAQRGITRPRASVAGTDHRHYQSATNSVIDSEPAFWAASPVASATGGAVGYGATGEAVAAVGGVPVPEREPGGSPPTRKPPAKGTFSNVPVVRARGATGAKVPPPDKKKPPAVPSEKAGLLQ